MVLRDHTVTDLVDTIESMLKAKGESEDALWELGNAQSRNITRFNEEISRLRGILDIHDGTAYYKK